MRFLRLLLLPFAWLYGCGMAVRNFLYDKRILRSRMFKVPVISVGNLTMGGSGKTPHIEYLIRLLRDQHKTATLSRGYGRKTSGFFILRNRDPKQYGDEPVQYFAKFPGIVVSVGESRVEAIQKLMEKEKPEIILLDDAFQHRSVRPLVNILLIEYDSMQKHDFMLPAGNMREWSNGRKRADIMIVSKSPSVLVPIERNKVIEKLRPMPHQHLFFSFITYGDIIPFGEKQATVSSKYYFDNRYSILLVTGIANPSGLVEYLRRRSDKVEHIRFHDHYVYRKRDIERIKEHFDRIANKNKLILTTEKDMFRLQSRELRPLINELPFFYLPIEVAFHKTEDVTFDKLVMDAV